jgi:CubicO group peptidase (beta-lactamase class C family)
MTDFSSDTPPEPFEPRSPRPYARRPEPDRSGWPEHLPEDLSVSLSRELDEQEAAAQHSFLSRREALGVLSGVALVGLLGLPLAGRRTQPQGKPLAKPSAASQNASATASASASPAAPAFELPAAQLRDWPSVDALADRMVKLRFTPGLSLSVMHNGVMLYSKGFGLADIQTGAKITPQTGFRIASVTKQFTAAAILKLQEQGKLSVRDPLARFIPEFPQADRVTLDELMSHTSGMNDYLNHQSQSVLEAAQTRDYSSAELLQIISAIRPAYSLPPGKRWLYSNSAFSLLGIVVERASGMNLAQFYRTHLFTPAGLSQTTMDEPCSAFDGCDGYRPNFRTHTGFDPILPVSPTFAGGAGGIRSTSEDLARWHYALFSGHVLQPHSLTQMMTPMLLKDGTPAWEYVGPEKLNYGFGQGIGHLDGHLFIAHGGRLNGYTSHLRSLVGERLSVSVLYNSDGTGVPGFTNAQRALRIEAMKMGMKDMRIA